MKHILFALFFLCGGKSVDLQGVDLHSVGLLGQQSIPQKLADSPKDSIIKVLDESGKIRCYMPDVRSVYVVIGTCRTSWAKPARYDVFG